MVAASPIPAHDPHDATAPPAPRPTLPGITPDDRALLAQLKSPEGLASMDDAEYAAWIERPEIQKTIAAQEELRARIRRCIDDARAERYIQRLEAVLDNATDLTNDAQRADTRRAASLLLRITTRPTRVILPATLASAPRAPSSPIGGGGRAPRPVGAPSTRGFPSSSTSQPTTPHAPPKHESPAHLLTSSPAHPTTPSPSHLPSPPSPPASSIPGLHEAVAAFIRAAGTTAAGNQASLDDAAAHTAAHRRQDFGAEFPQWLETRCAMLRDAEARPGVILYQDDLDGAIQFVTLRRPTGAAQCLIHAVLERYPDGRNRWAVADVVTHDDPSTPPAHPARDDSS